MPQLHDSRSDSAPGATPDAVILARRGGVVGFSAGTDVAAGTQFYLRYDGELGAGNDNHALNVGVRLRW